MVSFKNKKVPFEMMSFLDASYVLILKDDTIKRLEMMDAATIHANTETHTN